MNHWCESCARKNLCYVVDDRPKCFVPITNTASGTPESYLAKSLRFSRDGHEIDKTENSSEKPNNCDEPQKWETPPKFEHKGITTTCVGVPACLLEIEDEPQTEDEILREQCRAFMGIVEQTEREGE